MYSMKITNLILIVFLSTLIVGYSKPIEDSPVNALLITGGCCHDYDFQKQALTTGIAQHAPIEWTIVQEGGESKDFQSKLYNNPDWAREYDVVVHNECFAQTKNPAPRRNAVCLFFQKIVGLCSEEKLILIVAFVPAV